MSRTATATDAGTLDDAYDQLSLDERDAFDAIAAAGYKPVQAGRGWKAEKDGGTIGPFPDLQQLNDAVFVETEQVFPNEIDEPEGDVIPDETIEGMPTEKEPKVIKLDADADGNRYLEGMEPVVDSEIASAAREYHAFKTDRVNLLNKETQAKEKLIDICHRKRHLFKSDPENTNAKIYKAGDLVIRMENEVKEKISTEIKREGKK